MRLFEVEDRFVDDLETVLRNQIGRSDAEHTSSVLTWEEMFESQRPELKQTQVSDQSSEESDGVKIAGNLKDAPTEDIAQYTGENNTNPESAMYI